MKPFVVGIAGGSCSGKSTFARRLASQHPDAIVISLDSFYTRDMQRGPLITLSDGSALFDFNQPSAINVNEAVSAIQTAEAQMVIVEGLFTLAIDTIRELLRYSVFVHLDADLRALRRMLRDMRGGRASTDPEFIARYYIESARVGHAEFVEPSRIFADRVVVGDDEGMVQALMDLQSMNLT